MPRCCLAITCLVTVALLPLACNRGPSGSAVSPSAEASREQVEHFCAACHLLPQPDSLPLRKWAEEVEEGYRF